MQKARPFHPLLFAAFPVLSLFSANVRQVATTTVIVPLVAALAGAIVALVIGRMISRDSRRVALVVSIIALLTFSYGYAYKAVEGRSIGDVLIGGDLLLLPAYILIGSGLVVSAVRARGDLLKATSLLNVVSIGLVVSALVGIAAFKVPTAMRGTDTDDAFSSVPVESSGAGGRDIYYVILDRYSGEDSMRNVYGFDNSQFLDALRNKGFFIAGVARSSYPDTSHSVAAALNMDTLDGLAAQVGRSSGDWQPLYEAIQRNKVVPFLQRRGYRYVHVGSWWEATHTSPLADENLSYDSRSEFTQVLFDYSILRPIAKVLGVGEDRLDSRRAHWRRIRFQFEELARANRPGPTFVFAHILSPHYPFAFSPDGRFVSLDEERTMSRRDNYINQVKYANAQVLRWLDGLLAVPEGERPIVIIQSDEGSQPVRTDNLPGFGWGTTATQADLDEKFPILNAFYLPGLEGPRPSAHMNQINTFRFIFSRYFGADLQLLPDRSFVFRDPEHPYDFAEVTERVRAPSP